MKNQRYNNKDMDWGHISLWLRLPGEGRLVVSEALSPEHQEIVTFVQRGWSSVKTELEQGEHILSREGRIRRREKLALAQI